MSDAYNNNAVSRRSGGVRVVCGLVGLLWLGLGWVLQGAEADKVHPIAIQPIDPVAAVKVSYAREIKPLLARYCVECHGTTEPEGGYQVGSVAELLKSGKKNGRGIISGKPDESPVVRYIRGELKPQMPKGNPPVSAEGLHLLRQWISAGAKDDSAEVMLATANERAAWEKFDPRKHDTVAKARLTAEEMDALLSDETDGERRFLARRQWRVTQLPPAPALPSVSGPVFNGIDKFIVAKWQQGKLPEAQQAPTVADDVAFLRRVYLDVVGVVPTVNEAREFLIDQRADKRQQLVSKLLAEDAGYAYHWTTFWEDLLASADTNIRGGILTRGNYRSWIQARLFANKPYDLMVAELMDASLPGYRKAVEQRSFEETFEVGYIRNDTPVVTMETAANVGQVFLGTNMKCASCHSHFENPEWPQTKFLAFASAFSRRDLELVRCEKRTGELVAPAFPFEVPGAPRQLPMEEKERLHRVAQLLTDPLNPRFAQAMVNRLWKRCFGLGLVEPVDEFRSDRQASHPELLEWLAQELIRSGYDTKHILRLILTSRTYQLAYDALLADKFDPVQPTAPRYFRSPQLRRMSAEQLLDSLSVVGAQQDLGARRTLFRTTATTFTQAMGRPASRSEIITTRSEELAVLQFLEMLNGWEYQSFIYRAPVLDLLSGERDAGTAAEALYLAALNRMPSTAERQLAQQHLQPLLGRISTPPAGTEEVLLVEEMLPDIFRELKGKDGTNWNWGAKGTQPVLAGNASYRSQGGEKLVWQGFAIPAGMVIVNVGESLFAHVHPDPKNPPKSIWLRVAQDDVEYEILWSDEPLVRSTDPLRVQIYGGPLPKPGTWTRLEASFRKFQMINGPIKSISYGVVGGTVYWDNSGLVRRDRSSAIQPLGDVLWALLTSPEFQYIR